MLLVKLLESVGFEVREASNGQEAVDTWRAWDPRLIWMDVRMPILDGCEATRRLRALEGDVRQTKVVALTASAFEHDREAILESGCDGFVAKPFREQTIFDTMVELLGVRFLYEEDQAVREQPSESVLTAERLEALDGAALKALADALLTGHQKGALAAVEAMREADPELAAELERQVRGYAFDELLALIERQDEAAARGTTDGR
jgi:CheY-like chemotaxis protein